MSSNLQTVRNRICHRITTRGYSAGLLCALLLLFCANARLARYELQSRDLKLATAQRYLDRDDARLELSIAALLLLWCAAVLPVPRFVATTVSGMRTAVFALQHPGEFDPESHLRPPPRS
jgi:hypothetical protein